MSTFRQKISQIECPATEFTTCEDCCNDMAECEHKKRIDAICTEVEKIEAGLEGLKDPDIQARYYNNGIEKCQAFIRKELQ